MSTTIVGSPAISNTATTVAQSQESDEQIIDLTSYTFKQDVYDDTESIFSIGKKEIANLWSGSPSSSSSSSNNNNTISDTKRSSWISTGMEIIGLVLELFLMRELFIQCKSLWKTHVL